MLDTFIQLKNLQYLFFFNFKTVIYFISSDIKFVPFYFLIVYNDFYDECAESSHSSVIFDIVFSFSKFPSISKFFHPGTLFRAVFKVSSKH